MVGGHTQPKPSQNLEKQGSISSPGKISPYRGKVPENLRQLQEGREQGLRRPSQHSLRRNYNALIHEQKPQQYRASLMHMHTAHLLAPNKQRQHAHTVKFEHTLTGMWPAPGWPSEGTQGLGLQLQVLHRQHSSPVDLTANEGCVFRVTILFTFGRLSLFSVRLRQPAINSWPKHRLLPPPREHWLITKVKPSYSR